MMASTHPSVARTHTRLLIITPRKWIVGSVDPTNHLPNLEAMPTSFS